MKLKTIPLTYRITPNQRRHVKKWVAELRSGKWKKGFGKMYRDYERYCCLGVCSKIARDVKRVPSCNGYSFIYPNDPDEFSGYPRAEWFAKRFGFDYMSHIALLDENNDLPMSAPSLNDYGAPFDVVPFDVIADVIEAAILKRKEIIINA